MVQELIVYFILLLTAVHLIYKTILFFKPSGNNTNCSSCAVGSCSNCSLKFDFKSIKPDFDDSINRKK